MTTFATPRLDAIAPSLTNPCKTFDPARLDELTASIKASTYIFGPDEFERVEGGAL